MVLNQMTLHQLLQRSTHIFRGESTQHYDKSTKIYGSSFLSHKSKPLEILRPIKLLITAQKPAVILQNPIKRPMGTNTGEAKQDDASVKYPLRRASKQP